MYIPGQAVNCEILMLLFFAIGCAYGLAEGEEQQRSDILCSSSPNEKESMHT